MTDIAITNLTNATEATFGEGTGVFDKLMQTVTLHVTEEFTNGRIEGADYATVYLGSLQTVLAQAVDFLLKEQQAGKQADLIDSQIRESEEKIDLIAAQTAAEYEGINASKAKTTRDNLLNNKQVIKLQKEAILIERQTEKVIAEIQDQDYVTDFLRPEELAKITAETIGVTAKTTDQQFVTTNLRPEEVDLLQSRDAEQVAATTRNDNESTKKQALMDAQTLGFASDTKQKILKQMYDGFAVNLSIAGTGTAPESAKSIAIDDLAQEIITDVGSAVTI